MKQKLLLPLLLCLLAVGSAFAEGTREVTQSEAVSLITQKYGSGDVDIYIKQSTTEWTFFIDEYPMRGWPHGVTIASIPRQISESGSVTISEIHSNLPPSGYFDPVKIRNRYGSNAGLKFRVPHITMSNNDMETAKRTYAIIISGGIDKNSNYERYWNDCSLIYQTLVNTYNVPKSNIYPLMSDGTNPSIDMRLSTGGYASQSLDLDFDGGSDIRLPATGGALTQTIEEISSKIKQDDQLLVYVIDHGGRDYLGSYICLWGGEKIYDYELASYLIPIANKYVNVNVVLGQCFSGGFLNHLDKSGIVASAACNASQYSWACTNIPYDEFVYQWTSAINRRYPNGTTIDPDTDKDGYVSMKEAFVWACEQDYWVHGGYETPMYVSNPEYLGEELAINKIVPTVDLYIKDNYADTGKEPNTTTTVHWDSPSVWTRQKDDSVTEHQNPVYVAPDSTSATIYTWVHNRGRARYDGNGTWLHCNWALASTGFCASSWTGDDDLIDGKYSSGESLRTTIVPPVEPGDSVLVKVGWALPADLFGVTEGSFVKQHFCITARLFNTAVKNQPFPDGIDYKNVINDRKRAQKNMIVIRKLYRHNFTLLLRNILAEKYFYAVALQPMFPKDESLYSSADIELTLNPDALQAWQNGGEQSTSIYRAPGLNSNRFRFLDRYSRLENFAMEPLEISGVALSINFKEVPKEESYSFYLIQYDQDGNIVGGETFVIESPTAGEINSINATSEPDGSVALSVDCPDAVSTTWMNESGETIGTEDVMTVRPTPGNTDYKVAILSSDGSLGTASISLEPSCGIDAVTSNENGTVHVELLNVATANSAIHITPTTDNTPGVTYTPTAGEKSIDINASSLPSGIYAVVYAEDDKVVDSKKVVIK